MTEQTAIEMLLRICFIHVLVMYIIIATIRCRENNVVRSVSFQLCEKGLKFLHIFSKPVTSANLTGLSV